jgi:hypothetical protein
VTKLVGVSNLCNMRQLTDMIETNFFILNDEQYQQFYTEAQEHGMNIDHYLMEFCDVMGPMVYVSNE